MEDTGQRTANPSDDNKSQGCSSEENDVACTTLPTFGTQASDDEKESSLASSSLRKQGGSSCSSLSSTTSSSFQVTKNPRDVDSGEPNTLLSQKGEARNEKKEEESMAFQQSNNLTNGTTTTSATNNLETHQDHDEEQPNPKTEQKEEEDDDDDDKEEDDDEEEEGSEKDVEQKCLAQGQGGRFLRVDSYRFSDRSLGMNSTTGEPPVRRLSKPPSFRMTPVKVAAIHPLIQNLNKEDEVQNPKKRNPLSWQCCPRSIISAGLPIFIALFIVFLLFAGDDNNNTNDNGNHLAEEEETDPQWQMLKRVSGGDVFHPSTDRGRAAHWVLAADDDVASNATTVGWWSTEDRILQRYLLALLYHSTTRHNSTWRSCGGAPTTYPKVSCRFSMKEEEEEEQQRTNHASHSTSWLSPNTDECTWFGIECTSRGQVVRIHLEENGLHGTLPPELHLLSELQFLHLANNALSGTIPASLWTLQVLDLSHNVLTGTLPEELEMPRIMMKVLSLTDNLLHGPLPPPWLTRQEVPLLTLLQLGSNAFTGSIPTTLGRNLEVLELHHNQLQGGVPWELGTLERLQVLDVQHNPQLGGTLPDSIGNWTHLRHFYLSGLGLSGPLPSSLYELSQLEQFHAKNNALTGSLSDNVKNLEHLQQMDLAHNRLTGTIPAALGQLPHLEAVWLHNNALSGTMPSSVCRRVVEKTVKTLSSDCRMDDMGANVSLVSCPCCTMCCNAAAAAASMEDTGDVLCHTSPPGGTN